MNCQEFTELLDDGDIRNLSPAKRRGLDAHLATCAACAAEWRVQEKIALTPAMWVPAGFVAHCRHLVATGVAVWFTPRRVILYSTVLALAAAATLLSWRQGTHAEPATVMAVPASLPSAMQPAAEVAAPSVPQSSGPQAGKPPAGLFTVYVPPLQVEGDEDAEGIALAKTFRDRVLTLLLAVPDLKLVDGPADAGAVAADAFELRMRYSGTESPRPYQRGVDLEVGKSAEFAANAAAIAAEATMSPAERERSRGNRVVAGMQKQGAVLGVQTGSSGLLLVLGRIPTTAIFYNREAPPGFLENAAQQLVRNLRITLFPLDGSLEREALALLGNGSQSQAVRMRALNELLTYAARSGGVSHASPAMVRAGGEFALTVDASEAMGRVVVWNGLALTGSPELVPYLIRGLTEVAHAQTRVALVEILSENYGNDPRAQAALVAAAQSNDQETVRMAAMRASDPTRWQGSLVARLGNTTLSDAQRLQPIALMAPGDLGQLSASPKSKLVLDESQLRELGSLLVRIAPDKDAGDIGRRALFAAGAMESPDALDMLVEVADFLRAATAPSDEQRESIMRMRRTAHSLIAFRYAGYPKARAFIEKLADSTDAQESRDAQMQLRYMDTIGKTRSQQPAR